MTNKISKPNNNYIDEYIKEVGEFFKMPSTDVNVHLVMSRKEFDEIEGSKTADWVVGLTKDDTIYILDQDKFEQYSTHPKSDFGPTLKHEVAHIYFRKLKANGYPNWLDEGVACYIDGQNKYAPPEEVTIKILKHYYKSFDNKIYGLGRFMVAKIIEEFGKEKLFHLIQLKSQDPLYSELGTMFKWLK